MTHKKLLCGVWVLFFIILFANLASAVLTDYVTKLDYENNYDNEGTAANFQAQGSGNVFNDTVYKTGSYSLQTDGNGYAESNTSDNGGLGTGNFDFSVALWARTTSYGAGLAGIWKVGTDATANSGYGYFNDATHMGIGKYSTGINQYVSSGISLNTWYHFVWVYDSADNGVQLYVDGDLKNDSNLATPLDIGSSTFDTNWVGFSNKLPGFVDMVVIYDRELSGAEVATLFSQGGDPDAGGGGNASDTLNISYIKPDNGITLNTSAAYFNVTLNSTYDGNCTLYLSDNASQNIAANETGSFSAGNDVVVNMSKSLLEGNYSFYFACDNGNTTENSSTYTIFVNILDIDEVEILPDIIYTNDTIQGYCNGSTPDNTSLTYESLWYVNGQLFRNATSEQESADVYAPMLAGPYIYANLTKPDYATRLDMLFRHGHYLTPYNSTVLSSCWPAYDNVIAIRLYSQNYGVHESYAECFNGSAWTIFTLNSSGLPSGSGYGSGNYALAYDNNFSTGTCWDGYDWGSWTGDNDTACALWDETFTWFYGTSDYYPSGDKINVGNISPEDTSYLQNWTFSCRASNGIDWTEWMNSSTITIENSAPDQPTLNYPGNGYANVSTEAVLNITVTDMDGQNMTVSFYNASGSLIGTVSNIPNGSVANITWSGLYIGTNYSWYANITDGINITFSPTWNFTTFAPYSLTIPTGYINQSDTFILNISKSGVIPDINASFYHNGTSYSATKTEYGDYFIFSVDVTPASLGTLEAYWMVNISDQAAIRSYNISSNQTVYDWILDNCSASNNITLRMTIFSENVPATHLNGSVELEFIYWINDSSFTKTYSHAFNGSYTYNLCMTPVDATIHADAYILYTVPGGFTHRYYIVNGSFTNSTQNISLYNFDSTTGMSDLKITTRYQSNNNYFPNVISKLERLYVSESVWRTVQMDESGDFGQIFFNIIEENTDYRIIFMDRSNNILKTTEKMKFVCTTGICDLTFLLPTEPENATPATTVTTWSYDNDTGLLNISWEEFYGNHVTISYSVTKQTMTGPLTICSGSQTGAAGNMSCDTSSYSGLVLLTIIGTNSTSAWIELESDTLMDNIGQYEGAFWSFGIGLTCAAFGIFSPMGGIISMFIGMVAIYFLGIFTPITMTFLIIMAALSIIIGIKIRN